MRKVKIVCTIGPASDGPAVLEQLVQSGMNAARLNFSHGTHESHSQAIKVIRSTAERRGVAVAIIQDLQGPRIRIGDLPDAGVELSVGQTVRLRTMMLRSGGQLGALTVMDRTIVHDIPVTYQALTRDIRPGARILIDDGLVELQADRIADGAVECRVIAGGRLTSHKGMNLPGTVVSAPTLTDKDRDDVRFGVAQGVDYIALSFVRGAEDIIAAKQLIADCGRDVPVIAKIERQEAVTELEAILAQADGVMVARGDLGVELGPEAVPVLQKRIIAAANRHRRLVITATQMLESMTRQVRPTRAEASDVANAVFDGTDAVMLSAETAVGQHPVEVVQVMDRIVRAAEVETGPAFVRRVQADLGALPFDEAICLSAFSAAAAVGAGAIVAFSERGTTARFMSKQRPNAPIIAFTPSASTRRQMALYWGVLPHTMEQIPTTDERINEGERRLKAEGLVKTGQRLVILSGTRVGHPGGTNLMKLHEVM